MVAQAELPRALVAAVLRGELDDLGRGPAGAFAEERRGGEGEERKEEDEEGEEEVRGGEAGHCLLLVSCRFGFSCCGKVVEREMRMRYLVVGRCM